MIRVLIIEDDPLVADINEKYLAEVPGFTCVGSLRGPKSAISFLEEHTVDLILLDIFMPGATGLDLLANIRSAAKGVDVIVISAASDVHSIKRALRLGAVDYLIKPFEFERFHAALKTYQMEHMFVVEQERLSQDELDKVLLHQGPGETASTDLPKGLTRETLRKTVENILDGTSDGFSTGEISSLVGISRVSMRKYLTFLQRIGFLFGDLNYRSAGRPCYTYTVNRANMEALATFLSTAQGTSLVNGRHE